MKLKKIITAVLLASAMTVQTVSPIMAVNAEAETAPLLWYDFENAAADASGNGLDGTVNGAVVKNGMAVFDGTDDYIDMPDGILQNADSATVAIYLKSDIEKANQFTWCIGNTNTTGYMFLNTYNPSSNLRMAITTGTYTNEEAIASDKYVAAGEWTSIVAVFDGANSTLYRDGEVVGTSAMTIKPSDLGATAANYIAKSVYDDPYFRGSVADFRIYDKALTKEEVDALTEEQQNSYEKTAPEITAVSGEGIKSYGVEIDEVSKTLLIPVVPGTDIESLSPEFTCEREATVELTDGTYENGTITVTDAENSERTEEWTVTVAERGNAVLDGFYADPNIACFDGKYYIYPTTDGGTGWDAPYFKCFSSDDLVNWKDEGIILDLADVSWSNGKNGWAPTIAEKNGKYYFYYSAAPSTGGAKNLAVAVADSPTGPFVDKGVIAQGGKLSGQMIDPGVFVDDDGQGYIYWGNGAMYGAKLSDDMLSIQQDTIVTMTPSNFREASFVIKRDGKYYMMWSHDDTGSPNYHVRYGIMETPLGPINGNTTILHRNNTNESIIKGTGHHSVINVPGTDEWYICYHRFNTALYGDQETQSSAAGNHREVCIDKMEFDANGNIKTIVPTLTGITEPVYPKGSLVNISSVEANGDTLEYSLLASGDISEADVYAALYNSDGELEAVKVNELEGNFEIDPQDGHTLKVMVWENDGTMKPLSDCTQRNIKGDNELKLLAEELAPDSEIRGNQYMPAEYEGVNITWSTDNEAVAEDGTVTRGSSDTEINITAVFDNGVYTYEATYKSTVIAAPADKTEDDMAAYLFVHFVGTEGSATDEQIYFSVSRDGQKWETINEGMPVLTSVMGEMGVRDPHIIRSPEGDKFFLIATDLSIYNRRDDANRWGTCQTSGSRVIMVWESTDLVNWSEQRMIKVAPANAGCTWAPESVYDTEKGQYMVFWASKVSDDNYATQRIYRSYTSDFEHFTAPEVYIDGGNVSNIDTTFIKHDGVYYRFTKNESRSSVTMMKSTSLNGEFTDVATYTINGTAGNTITGYEGPTAYKINGEDKWCLLLDYYSKSQGYKPFMTNDITVGQFTAASDFNFDTKYRHGTVMPITLGEYTGLLKAYSKARMSGAGIVTEGSTAQYTATVNNNTVSAEWSVSDSNIAEINSNGMLTAKSEGTITVTAYIADYDMTVTKKVEIVKAEDSINTGLVMHITFDEENTGSGAFEAKGGTVTEKGTVSYAQGKNGNAVSIAYSAANYLELPDGVLSGAESASVSFWMKQNSSSSAGWAFMTTPVTGAQTYKSEKYLGVLLAGTQDKLTAERYYSNAQERPAHASASGSFGGWNYITINYEESKTVIYVNGEKVGEATSSAALGNLFTAGAKSWIGHANWEGGEGFAGMIDDFRLYSRTLSEAEIATLMSAE